jgi:hypothetical protein
MRWQTADGKVFELRLGRETSGLSSGATNSAKVCGHCGGAVGVLGDEVVGFAGVGGEVVELARGIAAGFGVGVE